jgi:adenylate kinase family enzyme
LQSTIGKELASLLTVPFISLDSLCWKPGWQKSTKDEMRHRVEEALADAPTGWVVDGNYRSTVPSSRIIARMSYVSVLTRQSSPKCND